MDSELYSYPEEEQTQRRKPNLGVFAGLFIGLIIGGLIGFTLGNQSTNGLEMLYQLSNPNTSPRVVMILFSVFIVALVSIKISLKLKGIRNDANQGAAVSKMIIVLVLGLLVFLLAGIYYFMAS